MLPCKVFAESARILSSRQNPRHRHLLRRVVGCRLSALRDGEEPGDRRIAWKAPNCHLRTLCRCDISPKWQFCAGQWSSRAVPYSSQTGQHLARSCSRLFLDIPPFPFSPLAGNIHSHHSTLTTHCHHSARIATDRASHPPSTVSLRLASHRPVVSTRSTG